MEYTGTVKKDARTKNLVARLVPGDIALIDHVDLDRVSAEALVATGVRVVINASASISGLYPNQGPSILLDAGVALVDETGRALFDELDEDQVITVKDGVILHEGQTLGSGTPLTRPVVERLMRLAEGSLDARLDEFVRNTLSYLKEEHAVLLSDMKVPVTRDQIAGRQTLVVTRGPSFAEDLKALRGYIAETHPAVIAVDGATDVLLRERIVPDVVIGDMDSVSDEGLRCGAQLIAHAYADGRCPAAGRLDALGLSYTEWALPCTSEDLGLLLAWHSHAELIVAVGSHTSLSDYLDKGRAGASSSFIVRLKVGDKLMDARGVSKLYRSVPRPRHVVPVIVAGLAVIALVIALSDPLRSAFQLLVLTVRAQLDVLF